jgi:hypothetical protein
MNARELTTPPTPTTLNVLRVALDRADLDYRATGFKDFEIEAAKAWVAAETDKHAITKQPHHLTGEQP